MNSRMLIFLFGGFLVACSARSQQVASVPLNEGTNTGEAKLFGSFPQTEAKRLAAGLLRNSSKDSSEAEQRRMARACLALFLPETARDYVRLSARKTAARIDKSYDDL